MRQVTDRGVCADCREQERAQLEDEKTRGKGNEKENEKRKARMKAANSMLGCSSHSRYIDAKPFGLDVADQ